MLTIILKAANSKQELTHIRKPIIFFTHSSMSQKRMVGYIKTNRQTSMKRTPNQVRFSYPVRFRSEGKMQSFIDSIV